MTNEEMERAMQFIVERQAQFAANQQQSGERLTQLEANAASLGATVAEMAASQQQTNERVARLETNMAEMARTQAHLNEVVTVMVETHRHTEERLDAFIGVLERYISEGRSGRGGGEESK